MPPKDLLPFIQKLPQDVRDHIFDEKLADAYEKALAPFNLSSEQIRKLNDVIWQIYKKELALPNFITTLEKELHISSDKAAQLGIQVIGLDFLPIAQYLDVDVAGYLKELGADPHAFLESRDPKDVAEEIVERSGIRFEDERLHARFLDIIINRFNDVRDDLETKSVLMRGVKLGGLELDEEKTKKVLDLIGQELGGLGTKKVVFVGRPAVVLPPKQPVTSSGPPASSPVRPSMPKQEVVHAASPEPRMQEQKRLHVVTPPSAPQRPAPEAPSRVTTPMPVKQVLKSLGEAARAPQSLGGVVRFRPGDILAKEDVEELKSVVPKVPTSGALPLEHARKQILAEVYEKTKLQFDDPAIQKRFEIIIANRLKDIRDSAETKELLARAFNLGGMGLGADMTDVITGILDSGISAILEEVRFQKESEFQESKRKQADEVLKKQLAQTAKEERMLAQKWETLVKGKEEKRPVAPPQPILKTEKKKEKPREVSAPAPVQPPASLEDVKYTPRLVGPVEELKNFSVDDLRKLAAKSADAVQRIQDKIATLRGEGFDQKTRGVQALKTSPLFHMYGEIIQESFKTGKHPREIIESFKAVGKPSLSEEEFNAIMKLSSALNY